MGKGHKPGAKDRWALRRFLDGRMSAAEAEAFEQRLNDDAILKDALANEMAARVLVELSTLGNPPRTLGRNCRRARRMMPAYRSGVLATVDVAAFAAHLDRCDGCRTAYAILEETGELPRARRPLRETVGPAVLAVLLLGIGSFAFLYPRTTGTDAARSVASAAAVFALPGCSLPSSLEVFSLHVADVRTRLLGLVEVGQTTEALDDAFAELCDQNRAVLDTLSAVAPVPEWLTLVGAAPAEIEVRRLVAGGCVLIFDRSLDESARVLFLECLARNLGPRSTELLFRFLATYESVPFAQAAARLIRDIDLDSPQREADRLKALFDHAVAQQRPHVAASIALALRPPLGIRYFECLRTLSAGTALGDWPENETMPANYGLLLLRDQERRDPAGLPAVRALLATVVEDASRPLLARIHALVAASSENLPVATTGRALGFLSSGRRQEVSALEPWLSPRVTAADLPVLQAIEASPESTAAAVGAASRLIARIGSTSGAQ